MFTQEELEYIREQLGEDYFNKMVKTIELANEGNQIKQELTDYLTKIYTDLEARENLEKAFKKANLPIDIPEDPYIKEIKRIKSNVKEIERKIEEKDIANEIKRRLEEYGITPDEYDDLIQFQKQYAIKNGLKAIELYAMYKKQNAPYEIEPTRFKTMFEPKEFNEEEAYKKTIQELNRLIRG